MEVKKTIPLFEVWNKTIGSYRKTGFCCRCGDCCRIHGDPFSNNPKGGTACSKLVDNQCSIHGRGNAEEQRFWNAGCNDWPRHPDDLRDVPNCTFRFVAE